TRLQGDWSSDVCSSDLATNGVFSGKLTAGSLRRSFTGLFDSDLHAQLVVLRGKEAPWIIQLQIAADNPTVLSGSVSDGNWTVQLDRKSTRLNSSHLVIS